MKTYTVVGLVARLAAGRVRLTPEQARHRLRQLRALGDELYEITGPVEFKQDEQFGYDGEVPKAMATELAPVSAETTADGSGGGSEPQTANTESAAGLVGTLLGKRPTKARTTKP